MYFTQRFYLSAAVIVCTMAIGHFAGLPFGVSATLLAAGIALTLADSAALWAFGRNAVEARRTVAERLSNGDDNPVTIDVESILPFAIDITVIDELPVQFQMRNAAYPLHVDKQGHAQLVYHIRPTERGSYGFGRIRLFVRTPLALVERRFTKGDPKDVKVYPSYLMLRRYELLAMSNNLQEMGIKRIRRPGNNTDFDEIKDYVEGDDYRTINWRATARRHHLMVNVYQEERSQQVISVIDKGRMMHRAWRGMTLLDYAINAALVLSYVATRRDDRAGLVTFADHFDTFVPPERRSGQMQRLLEALYNQQTDFAETDFSQLLTGLTRSLSRRSLLILFTDFLGIHALERQLPILRQIALRHRLLIVFFSDEQQEDYIATRPTDTEDYYRHVIAEKYAAEQQLIVSTLRRYGIQALLTTPRHLSIDAVNRYLQMAY